MRWDVAGMSLEWAFGLYVATMRSSRLGQVTVNLCMRQQKHQ